MKDSHPAIVSSEVFDKVQEEMAKRLMVVSNEGGTVETSESKYNGKYLLGNLPVCDDCHASYRRRTEPGQGFGAVQPELTKAKRHAFTPPLWKKDGCRILSAWLFARTELMMKV